VSVRVEEEEDREEMSHFMPIIRAKFNTKFKIKLTNEVAIEVAGVLLLGFSTWCGDISHAST